MKRRAPWTVLIAAGFTVVSSVAPAQPQAATPPAPPRQAAFVTVQDLFMQDRLPELDPLVADLVANGRVDEDGMPELMGATEFLGYIAVPNNGDLSTGENRIHAWLASDPKSPFAPILEAIRLTETAWRARGGGYSSEVTDEGWEIFHEGNRAAWNVLMDTRKRSSHIPAWYEYAISSGRDARLPEAQLRAIFDEGKKRFPKYYGIYFAYQRAFAPNWGGDYQAADAFIREQVDSPGNKDGDVLYTRLYWALDGVQNSPNDFFEDSRVDWPRMRKGFEQMLNSYPNSMKNLTLFGAFACRAHDRETYLRLRPKLTGDNFRDLVPSKYTLQVCDRRFSSGIL